MENYTTHNDKITFLISIKKVKLPTMNGEASNIFETILL